MIHTFLFFSFFLLFYVLRHYPNWQGENDISRSFTDVSKSTSWKRFLRRSLLLIIYSVQLRTTAKHYTQFAQLPTMLKELAQEICHIQEVFWKKNDPYYLSLYCFIDSSSFEHSAIWRKHVRKNRIMWKSLCIQFT